MVLRIEVRLGVLVSLLAPGGSCPWGSARYPHNGTGGAAKNVFKRHTHRSLGRDTRAQIQLRTSV